VWKVIWSWRGKWFTILKSEEIQWGRGKRSVKNDSVSSENCESFWESVNDCGVTGNTRNESDKVKMIYFNSNSND
jgi:hypothetical protein